MAITLTRKTSAFVWVVGDFYMLVAFVLVSTSPLPRTDGNGTLADGSDDHNLVVIGPIGPVMSAPWDTRHANGKRTFVERDPSALERHRGRSHSLTGKAVRHRRAELFDSTTTPPLTLGTFKAKSPVEQTGARGGRVTFVAEYEAVGVAHIITDFSWLVQRRFSDNNTLYGPQNPVPMFQDGNGTNIEAVFTQYTNTADNRVAVTELKIQTTSGMLEDSAFRPRITIDNAVFQAPFAFHVDVVTTSPTVSASSGVTTTVSSGTTATSSMSRTTSVATDPTTVATSAATTNATTIASSDTTATSDGTVTNVTAIATSDAPVTTSTTQATSDIRTAISTTTATRDTTATAARNSSGDPANGRGSSALSLPSTFSPMSSTLSVNGTMTDYFPDNSTGIGLNETDIEASNGTDSDLLADNVTSSMPHEPGTTTTTTLSGPRNVSTAARNLDESGSDQDLLLKAALPAGVVLFVGVLAFIANKHYRNGTHSGIHTIQLSELGDRPPAMEPRTISSKPSAGNVAVYMGESVDRSEEHLVHDEEMYSAANLIEDGDAEDVYDCLSNVDTCSYNLTAISEEQPRRQNNMLTPGKVKLSPRPSISLSQGNYSIYSAAVDISSYEGNTNIPSLTDSMPCSALPVSPTDLGQRARLQHSASLNPGQLNTSQEKLVSEVVYVVGKSASLQTVPLHRNATVHVLSSRKHGQLQLPNRLHTEPDSDTEEILASNSACEAEALQTRTPVEITCSSMQNTLSHSESEGAAPIAINKSAIEILQHEEDLCEPPVAELMQVPGAFIEVYQSPVTPDVTTVKKTPPVAPRNKVESPMTANVSPVKKRPVATPRKVVSKVIPKLIEPIHTDPVEKPEELGDSLFRLDSVGYVAPSEYRKGRTSVKPALPGLSSMPPVPSPLMPGLQITDEDIYSSVAVQTTHDIPAFEVDIQQGRSTVAFQQLGQESYDHLESMSNPEPQTEETSSKRASGRGYKSVKKKQKKAQHSAKAVQKISSG